MILYRTLELLMRRVGTLTNAPLVLLRVLHDGREWWVIDWRDGAPLEWHPWARPSPEC